MNKFQISNFGPIKNLDVELGDLTILLGPQASGKTLFLQLAKLIVDKDYIVQNLLKYNYVID
ncbi:MAG: AAA family ATPase, partial [Bacteroidales bacterium]|nr:AAA family ATPase [Bacteroidales bacterium]